MVQDTGAMTVTLDPHDSAAFRKLDYWQQWDAMCGHASRPETSPLKLMLYFVGMALAAMHVAVVYVLPRQRERKVAQWVRGRAWLYE